MVKCRGQISLCAPCAVHHWWRWYYRKYIDVRRGGIGGVGMLLVGYCVLSYMWSYEHLREKWRKAARTGF
uniref:ATP synthase subunit f, mitochondrial n=1 Tax=Denticeps clupeoides TaxID=299321 RepID=A0AAY4A1G9_9TELE